MLLMIVIMIVMEVLYSNYKVKVQSNLKLYTFAVSPIYSVVTLSFFSTTSYRNVVDLSMSAYKGGALTTATNPAYEIMKQRGGGGGGGEP